MLLLRKILGTIWKVYFLCCLIVTLLLLYPLYRVVLMNERYFRFGFQLCRFQSLLMQILGGIYYRVEKKTTLEKNKPYIFVCNHTSYLDIILTTRILNHYFHFMGKKELLHVPLFNIFFKRFNIPVDRKSVKASHQSFIEAAKRIDKGASMLIFPEGTIPHQAPRMKAFKSGAFRLAIEKQIEIVPVVFPDNWKMLADNEFFSPLARPGIARAIVHNPIPTKGMSENDLVFLQNHIFHIIDNTLKEYRAYD